MSLRISSSIQLSRKCSDFDSRLLLDRASNERNADLVIDALVHFSRRETGSARDAANATHNVLSWASDQAFEDWVLVCIRVIENRFNNKIWLRPADDWGVNYYLDGECYRPNIKCLLRIRSVPANARKHLWLDCYRVPPSYCTPPPATVPTGPAFISYVQSRSYGRLANVDSHPCAVAGTIQQVAAHEFGHYLGLSDAGVGSPDCPSNGNTNAAACYQPSNDLMGAGGDIQEWHSGPWVNAVARHVEEAVSWSPVQQRPAPTLVRRSMRVMDGGMPASDAQVAAAGRSGTGIDASRSTNDFSMRAANTRNRR